MSEPETLPTAQARAVVQRYLQTLPEAPWPVERVLRLPPTAPKAGVARRAPPVPVWVRWALAAALCLLILRPDADLIGKGAQPPAAPTLREEVRAQVQALDRELQVAIRRGDSETQLAALWAERNAVAAQLASSTPARPARI